MELSSAGNFKGFRCLRIFHPERDIRIELSIEAIPQVTARDELAFLPRKGRIIHNEIHGDRRLGNLLELNGLRCFRRAERVSDLKIRNAGDGNNRADSRFFDLHFIQTLEFIKLADFGLYHAIRLMMIDNHHFIIHAKRSVIDLSDADPADILIIINCRDQHLRRCIRISDGRRNVIDDRVQQRFQILPLFIRIHGRDARSGRGKNKGAVELLVIGAQIHQQLQHLINHFLRSGFRPVNLIDTNNHGMMQFHCLPQHKLRLRHRPLEGIYDQNDTIDHLEYTFHLTAKIGVPGRIDDVDFHILIIDCRIFG